MDKKNSKAFSFDEILATNVFFQINFCFGELEKRIEFPYDFICLHSKPFAGKTNIKIELQSSFHPIRLRLLLLNPFKCGDSGPNIC